MAAKSSIDYLMVSDIENTMKHSSFALLLYAYIIGIAEATWLFSQAKVCDPKQKGVFPFTGFKIYREYRIEGYGGHAGHFLTIIHCDHGKQDYEKNIRTASSTDIDWNKPFCVLKPDLATKLQPKAQDKVYNLVLNKTINSFNNTAGNISRGVPNERLKFFAASNSSNMRRTDKKTENENLLASAVGAIRRFRSTILKAMDNKLERVIKGKHLRYTSAHTSTHLDDIRNADPQSSLEWESRNLVCFKMARKKKYAKRNILFYMPYTFIGGLFECPIPKANRREVFQSFTSVDFLKSFDFKCDGSIAKPVLPLIAEDSTSQWIEAGFNLFNPKLVQKIPYLSTATTLDLRFATSNTPDMFLDTWASKIDVNEDYEYTDLDLNLVAKAVSLSADYLHKFLKPMDISALLGDLNLLKTYGIKEPPQIVKQYVIKKFNTLSLDQKANLAISAFNSTLDSLSHIKKLQAIWDSTVN